MFERLKQQIGRKLLGPETQETGDFYSRAGKMDTGFKFGETLSSVDLEFAGRRDPLCRRITFGIAYELFRRGFVVEKVSRDRGQPGDVDDQLTDEVMDLYYNYNLDASAPQLVGLERLYGWAVGPVLKDAGEIWMEPKSERQINNLEYTKRGDIRRVEIARYHGDKFSYLWVGPKDFVHCRTRPREDLPFHQGVSLLEAIWDVAETLRKTTWGGGQRFYRYGGFPHVKIAGANQEKLTEFQKKFGSLSPRTEVFTNEQTEIGLLGLSGAALDPIKYMDLNLYQISIETGIPMEVLKGESEATLASGAISHHSYFS